MKKKIVVLLLALLVMLSSVGCGTAVDFQEPSAVAEGETGSGATHIVEDHAGNQVEVPYEINRIAVCDIYPIPSVLAVFFDSAEKIVGMAGPSMAAAKNSLLGELYPELLNAETGYINGSTVNTEELMALQPDVVFYSATQKEQGEQLRNAGFAAIGISVNKWQYNAIETLDNWMKLFDELFPGNEREKMVTEYSEKVFQLVQDRVKDIPEEEKEKVFFLFQYSDTTLLTSGKQFFGQWWADAIGAVNVAEELEKDNSVAASMEQIYAWDPSLIFITNFTSAYPEDLYGNTIGSYDWSAVKAVQNQRVYKMPLGMYRSYTPGIDTPMTLLWLAKSAYPEKFEDINMTEQVRDYYQTVFGVELTDDQVNRIFTPVAAASAF